MICRKNQQTCFYVIEWRKQAQPKNCIFLIFSHENNIAKLVSDMWVNCFHRLCQLLCNWIWVNTIFKCNHSQMIYKTVVLKDLQNLQDPRHVDFISGVFLQILASGFFSQWTKLKGDSSSGVSLQVLWIFYRTLFDNCFWIFSSELIETCFFSIFEYAVL